MGYQSLGRLIGSNTESFFFSDLHSDSVPRHLCRPARGETLVVRDKNQEPNLFGTVTTDVLILTSGPSERILLSEILTISLRHSSGILDARFGYIAGLFD